MDFKKYFSRKKMEDNKEKDLLENDELLQENLEETPNAANNEETAQLKAQVEELKDKYMRLMADFDNFRKQQMKQRAELIQTASRDTMKSLLPVLDDFDRAAKNEEFSEGIQLVFQKFNNALKANGLKEMETPQGTNFDADLHEAITEIPAFTDDLKGKVIDTTEKGYFINDKIIRHAKVVVGK
jgi:molecular chaperone GrpE